MIAVTTHDDVAHALALSDLGVGLLLIAVLLAVILWLTRRGTGPGVVDGSTWSPEEPRVTIAERRPFDQDCPHLARTRGGDGWRFRCLDCGTDLGE